MVKVILVPDIMQHTKQHEIEKHNNYNFVISEQITDIFKSADLVVGNLETTIGYGETSGFPNFRANHNFLNILRDIDVFCLANNHINDFGLDGIKHTKNAVLNIGKQFVGVDGQNGINFTDNKGNKYYVQSFTKLLNVKDKNKMVCTKFQKEKLGDRIGILFSHEGVEYSTQETSEQKSTKQLAKDYGYSVCVMIHSHVIGKQELIDNKMFSTNGLGNFISYQKNLDRQIGRIVELRIDETTKYIMGIVFYDVETTIKDNKQSLDIINVVVM